MCPIPFSAQCGDFVLDFTCPSPPFTGSYVAASCPGSAPRPRVPAAVLSGARGSAVRVTGTCSCGGAPLPGPPCEGVLRSPPSVTGSGVPEPRPLQRPQHRPCRGGPATRPPGLSEVALVCVHSVATFSVVSFVPTCSARFPRGLFIFVVLTVTHVRSVLCFHLLSVVVVCS